MILMWVLINDRGNSLCRGLGLYLTAVEVRPLLYLCYGMDFDLLMSSEFQKVKVLSTGALLLSTHILVYIQRIFFSANCNCLFFFFTCYIQTCNT